MYGTTPTGSGYGVEGSATTGRGVQGTATTGWGVCGTATATGGIGIYGEALVSGAYAGYFANVNGTGAYLAGPTYGAALFGNTYCAQTLYVAGNFGSGGTKNFKIDHPLDPENKYLYHASVESSEVKNIYDGVVTLDGNGEATVNLPKWFETLNKDFRYQLTAVGGPGPNLHIARKISGNWFIIGGGSPGLEVCWQVTGNRNDAWVKAHPMIVEEDKAAAERGTYLAPEEHGQSKEKGADWAIRAKAHFPAATPKQ